MKTGYNLKTAANIPSLMLSVGTVAAGTACALLRGEMEWIPATVCLVLGISAQLSNNYLSAYSSVQRHLGRSLAGPNADPNSGQVLLMQQFHYVALIISVTMALALLTLSGWVFFVPLLLFYAISFFYSGGPKPLSETVFAPLCPFLGYGIIGVAATAYAQFIHDNPDPDHWYYVSTIVFTSIGMGFMAANVLYISCYGTYDRDRVDGIRTFPMVFGMATTRWMVFINGLLLLILFGVFCFTQNVRTPLVAMIPTIICFITNTAIFLSMKKIYPNGPDADADLEVNDRLTRYALYNYALLGILMLIFSAIAGDADRSLLIYY